MKQQIGQRVGAIMDSNDKQVRIFGYGKYAGDEIHPKLGFPNPKIELDDGKVVWGCECWWGPEDEIKQHIGNKVVVMMDIEKERAEAQKQQ